MSTLHIALLGDFSLTYDEQVTTAVNTARLQALLAYLVLHRNAPQSRRHLAFLLWPDSSEAQARTNLRNLLHLLRQALPAVDDFLQVDTTPRTMAAGGQMTRAELSRTTQVALDNFFLWQDVTEGFGHHCLPALCWQYVAAVDGEQIHQWTKPAEVKTFLGAIDTLQDAVLLAAATGVISAELITPSADGYTVVVKRDGAGDDVNCELTSLNIYRELIHINHAGQLSVVARKLTDRFCGVF